MIAGRHGNYNNTETGVAPPIQCHTLYLFELQNISPYKINIIAKIDETM
jgi:hypothetical protein